MFAKKRPTTTCSRASSRQTTWRLAFPWETLFSCTACSSCDHVTLSCDFVSMYSAIACWLVITSVLKFVIRDSRSTAKFFGFREGYRTVLIEITLPKLSKLECRNPDKHKSLIFGLNPKNLDVGS